MSEPVTFQNSPLPRAGGGLGLQTPTSRFLPEAPAFAGQPDSGNAKLAAVSQQFEAIFVRQMLAEARKAHFGGGDLLGGQGMDTFRQMQDERFADIAAERGSFGLAKMIEAQIAQFPSRLREGPGVGPSELGTISPAPHPQPLPQAGGEQVGLSSKGSN